MFNVNDQNNLNIILSSYIPGLFKEHQQFNFIHGSFTIRKY